MLALADAQGMHGGALRSPVGGRSPGSTFRAVLRRSSRGGGPSPRRRSVTAVAAFAAASTTKLTATADAEPTRAGGALGMLGAGMDEVKGEALAICELLVVELLAIGCACESVSERLVRLRAGHWIHANQ